MSISNNNGSSWQQGQQSSQGSSQNSSNSQSNSFIPDYEPQLGFLEQFGNVAGQLGDQQYNWAQDQFANNGALTDQNINDYLAQHDLANQGATRDFSNYNDIFNPAAGSLTSDWQSYVSPGRVADEMGRSEAGVAQNFEHQRGNIERNLRDFGVNPSDPRYAGAMAANRTAQAASEAGAGTQARINTENTGRQLRQQALNEAHLLPGQQATFQNVGMQGLTGAQNAAFGNTSLGALTMGTAPQYLNAGINDVRFQPLGNSQQASSRGSSTQSSQGNNAGGSVNHGSSVSAGGGGGGGGSGSGGGSSGGGGRPSSGSPDTATRRDTFAQPRSGGGSGQQVQPNSNTTTVPPGEEWTGLPDQGTGGWLPPDGGDWNGLGQPDQNLPPLDGGGDEFFAAGGAIPDHGGGYVPASMSPSGGQQTDDIPATINQTGGEARLNADEFVIPQDVVQWMGHKFFQDLIMKSRKARMQNPGPAHPTMQGGAEHHAMGGETGMSTFGDGDPTATPAPMERPSDSPSGGMPWQNSGASVPSSSWNSSWSQQGMPAPSVGNSNMPNVQALMQQYGIAGSGMSGSSVPRPPPMTDPGPSQADRGGGAMADTSGAMRPPVTSDPGPSAAQGGAASGWSRPQLDGQQGGVNHTHHIPMSQQNGNWWMRPQGSGGISGGGAQGLGRSGFQRQGSYFNAPRPFSPTQRAGWQDVHAPRPGQTQQQGGGGAAGGATGGGGSSGSGTGNGNAPAGWMISNGRWVQDPNYDVTNVNGTLTHDPSMSINSAVARGQYSANGDGTYNVNNWDSVNGLRPGPQGGMYTSPDQPEPAPPPAPAQPEGRYSVPNGNGGPNRSAPWSMSASRIRS